jgi:hypothetical protein
MDVLLLILSCFYFSKKIKEKGYQPRPWIWRLIGLFILFELIGASISLAITHGDITMAAIFGFVCAAGAPLLIKSRVDKLPYNNTTDDSNGSDIF